MPRNLRPWLTLAALAAVVLAFLALRPGAENATRGPTRPAAASLVDLPSPAPETLAEPSAPLPAPFTPDRPSRPPLATTAALVAWLDRHLAAAPANRPALIAEGLALALARRAELAALIRTDPEAALASAFPRARRAELPAVIAAELETLVSARAEFGVIQTCFHPPGTAHDPAEDLYRATVIAGREYRVHTYGSRLRDASLPATSLIGIGLDSDLAISPSRYRPLDPGEPGYATSGLAVEADGGVTVLPSATDLPAFSAALLATEQNPVVNAADSGSGTSTVSGRPSAAWTQGVKALLVIRVDFSDLAGTPINKFDGNAQITPAYIDNVINGASGVRAFMRENSFESSDLDFDPASDVTDVLRLPRTASSYATSGNNSLLHSDARAAATTAGFAVGTYDRVAVVFTYLGDLADSEITYGGLGNIIGANLWINGAFDLRVVAHELGHNHGLRHANLWQVPGADPVDLAGTSTEYGDPFDIMGDGDFSENHFSPWNKSLLQWIPDASVTVAAASGTFRVHRFDASAANLALPRALKLVRDTTRDYWIGYRRATSNASADNGAYVLWGYNDNQQGNLLDLVTPGTNPNNAPLPLNTTFTDTAAGIALRPVAQGGSGADEWLDVQVTLQPRLAWVASTYVVNEQGGSAVLTVTRTANSTGAVSVSYATTAGTATATTDYTTTTGTLAWADGDVTPKTITVPVVIDVLVEGTETFTLTLSAPVGGVVVAPASTTVTVADPGARDPSFAMPLTGSNINRVLVQPDGNILVAGAFTFIQTPDSTVYEYGRIARMTPTAAVDPDFDPGVGADASIQALARQPDGKILIGGDFANVGGVARPRLARLMTDGSVDTTFTVGAGPDGTVRDIVIQPDGRILIAGAFANYGGTARNRIARLLPDGTLDATFANPTYSSGNGLRSLALQPDGKILAAGGLTYGFGSGGGTGFKSGLVRLFADGTRDTSLDVGYGAHTSSANNTTTTINRVALLPDGGILVAGSFTGFGNNFTPRRIARLSSGGVLDTTFLPLADATVNALLPLPEGSVLVGGDFTTIGGATATRIARIKPDGTLDIAFAAAGGHGDTVRDLALQPDGNVLLAGNFDSFQGSADIRPLWRLVPGLSGLPGVLQFSTDAYAGSEGASATLTVDRVGGSLGALTLGYATAHGGGGTSTPATDFTVSSGALTWADGDAAAKTFTIPLALDATADTPETLLVNLGAPQLGGALLGERQQAVVTIRTAYAAWQATRFTTPELADSAISGDTADPDGDGLNNLTEFALSREPRVADSAAAWTTAVQNVSGTNYLTITFRRRAPALDLAYAVQSTADLAGTPTWTPDAVQVGSATPNGDGTETVTYRDAVASDATPRRFLRVSVTRTP